MATATKHRSGNPRGWRSGRWPGLALAFLIGGCAPLGLVVFLSEAFSFSSGLGRTTEYVWGFCQLLVGVNLGFAAVLLGTSRLAPWRIALVALQAPLILMLSRNLAELFRSLTNYSIWAIDWQWGDVGVEFMGGVWLVAGLLCFPLLAGQLLRFGLVGRREDYRATIGQLLIFTALLAAAIAVTQQVTRWYPQIPLGNNEFVTISISLWELMAPGLVSSAYGLVALLALLIVYRFRRGVSLAVLSAVVLSLVAAVLGTMVASGAAGELQLFPLIISSTAGMWGWLMIVVQLWVYRRVGWELRWQRRQTVAESETARTVEVADPLGPI